MNINTAYRFQRAKERQQIKEIRRFQAVPAKRLAELLLVDQETLELSVRNKHPLCGFPIYQWGNGWPRTNGTYSQYNVPIGQYRQILAVYENWQQLKRTYNDTQTA